MVVLSEAGTGGLQVAFWPEQSAPLPVVLVMEDEAHQGLGGLIDSYMRFRQNIESVNLPL